MRLFGLHHPDQVDDLPAGFTAWALAFHMVENEAQAENDEEAARRARNQ